MQDVRQDPARRGLVQQVPEGVQGQARGVLLRADRGRPGQAVGAKARGGPVQEGVDLQALRRAQRGGEEGHRPQHPEDHTRPFREQERGGGGGDEGAARDRHRRQPDRRLQGPVRRRQHLRKVQRPGQHRPPPHRRPRPLQAHPRRRRRAPVARPLGGQAGEPAAREPPRAAGAHKAQRGHGRGGRVQRGRPHGEAAGDHRRQHRPEARAGEGGASQDDT
mmetsp:Transcript_3689/g.7793  ORF Transcript_3689/g.7793 Transcript_3689/m.7793 type:complete len:220 (-) Transcript_3689:529-1188(-)